MFQWPRSLLRPLLLCQLVHLSEFPPIPQNLPKFPKISWNPLITYPITCDVHWIQVLNRVNLCEYECQVNVNASLDPLYSTPYDNSIATASSAGQGLGWIMRKGCLRKPKKHVGKWIYAILFAQKKKKASSDLYQQGKHFGVITNFFFWWLFFISLL